MSRLRQRRHAVALWRYERRCAALNGVRVGRPADMLLDDKPLWLAPVLRRFISAIRQPKPARTPRVWRRLSPEQQERVLFALSRPLYYGRYRLYGALGLDSAWFRVPYGGA